jgi:hypothetical protein
VTRRVLTPAQEDEAFRRHGAGEGTRRIAAGLRCSRRTVQRVLGRRGAHDRPGSGAPARCAGSGRAGGLGAAAPGPVLEPNYPPAKMLRLLDAELLLLSLRWGNWTDADAEESRRRLGEALRRAPTDAWTQVAQSVAATMNDRVAERVRAERRARSELEERGRAAWADITERLGQEERYLRRRIAGLPDASSTSALVAMRDEFSRARALLDRAVRAETLPARTEAHVDGLVRDALARLEPLLRCRS